MSEPLCDAEEVELPFNDEPEGAGESCECGSFLHARCVPAPTYR